MPESKHQEYVINPATGRVIRKNGPTYRRWRRANPNAPPPRILSESLSTNSSDEKHTVSHTPHSTPCLLTPDDPLDTSVKTLPVSVPTSISAASLRHEFKSSDSHGHRTTKEEPMSAPLPTNSFTQSNGREPQSAPPPLLRSNAMGPDDLHDLLNVSNNSTHPSIECHDVNMGYVCDSDIVADQLLIDRGPELLQAYENPEVDFLETLAEAFGITENTSV